MNPRLLVRLLSRAQGGGGLSLSRVRRGLIKLFISLRRLKLKGGESALNSKPTANTAAGEDDSIPAGGAMRVFARRGDGGGRLTPACERLRPGGGAVRTARGRGSALAALALEQVEWIHLFIYS